MGRQSFGDFVAAGPVLLQRAFLIEVFPTLAPPCADTRQAHEDRVEALESALRDISCRRINGWPDRHTHAPNGPGGPRGRQLSQKGRVTCVCGAE